ncbi:unnamed protein product [Camellia sinensis]
MSHDGWSALTATPPSPAILPHRRFSKEDKKLKTLAKRNLWCQCVNCSHVVELPAGCNHIYCSEPKELRIRIAVLLTKFWLLIASLLVCFVINSFQKFLSHLIFF